MQKKMAIGGALIALLSMLALGTLAYLIATGKATNVITTGMVDISLYEMQIDSNGKEVAYDLQEPVSIMPGSCISKIPYIQNNGAPAYIRARADIVVTSPDSNELDANVVTLNVHDADWMLSDDGYYYYKETVNTNETINLFSAVTFDNDIDNVYQGCTVEINVSAEAVQSKNNDIPAGGTITDVTGWPKQEKV